MTYDKQDQFDEAISDYNKAIEIDPKYAKAYNNRGWVYHREGLYDKAISDYNKAIVINPRYAQAYVNRGVAYYRKGDNENACSDVIRACELEMCKGYDWIKSEGVVCKQP